MLPIHHKEKFENDLKGNMCRVQVFATDDPKDHDDEEQCTWRPYTRCEVETEGFTYKNNPELQPEVPDDCVLLWDILAEKYVVVPLARIGSWRHFQVDIEPDPDDRSIPIINHEQIVGHAPDLDNSSAFVLNAKKELEEEANEYVELNKEQLEHLYFSDRMTTNGGQWDILKYFHFKVSSLEELQECNHDDEKMKPLRECIMNRVRARREEAFKELDQLEEEAKKEGSTEDDLADIDIIKQMFRDIPQDTDLSQYTTIAELIEFWPSLLLPKPSDLNDGHLALINKSIKHPLPYDPGNDLKVLLDSVDDVEDLEKLLEGVSTDKDAKIPEYTIPLLEARIKDLKK
jgi:hypothetical protein